MSDPSFRILGARLDPSAAVPTLSFDVLVETARPGGVHGLSLACQVRIEPNRREHEPAEAALLLDLFGDTPRWGDTLRPFAWTHAAANVTAFEQSHRFALPIHCSYDLEVAGAKYLHALRGGDIPLLFLFSGTVFAEHEGRLSVARLPWDCEARHRLPVSTWRTLMDRYYPGSGWLRLGRETLDALTEFKARHAVPTWDETMQRLLQRKGT
jgi:hypothetical protein